MEIQYSKYAEQLAQWLVDLGYTHCFFVAGGNIMHLLDGVRSRMTCIPVVHEVSAGIAAEYFNETSREGKAFALVTAGPGLTNIVTAVAGAWLESRQLLVIGGQVKTDDLSRGEVRQRGIQEIDGVSIVASITKRSERLDEPITREAFRALVEEGSDGRPGPVFIEIPLDIQGMSAVRENSEEVKLEQGMVKGTSNLDAVLSAIAGAQRPVLLVGGGVSREMCADYSEHLRNLVMPLTTTWNGADRIPSEWPNYCGRPNTWGQRSANLIVAQSDLLIAVGTRLGLQQTGFNWQEFAPNAKIVQVDIDGAELEKGHPRVDIPVCTEANEFLREVLLKIKGAWPEWLKYCRSINRLLEISTEPNETGTGFISPYDFFEDINELSTESDILIPCSSGGANSTAMQTLRIKFGNVVVTNKGLASMGYGLAGAIGASLANPGRRTLLFEGDGGFAQNLQELATVDVNRLPIKIFLFANNGYGSIRMTQKNYFNGAYVGCDVDTGLGFPSWDGLFNSYNIKCTQLDRNWNTEPGVLASFESNDPHAYIVPIDPLQTYWPKITSRITERGGMESNPLHVMTPPLEDSIREKVTKYL
jgi:acetolactate synthase-1/2/3 large subunit